MNHVPERGMVARIGSKADFGWMIRKGAEGVAGISGSFGRGHSRSVTAA
jgi:hypothetical protein